MLRRGQPGIRWLGVFLCLVLGVAFGSVLVTFVAQGAFSGTGTVEGNTMSAAPVDHLSITPASSTVSPSHSQSYTVHALGVSPGNADFGDVTSNTTFTISGSGTCTGSACSATVAGTYTVTAHYWGLTVNATLTVSTAGATKVVFTTQPGSEGNSSAGTELSILPSVTVEDQFGNAVTTDSSTVTLSITTGTPASGGPGNVSACSQSETNGVITFSGCSIDAAGNGYELHAIDGDLTAADSATFDVGTASPAVMITNPNPPSTATAGTIIPATSITAQLLGSSGSNAAAAITFTVFGPQSSAPTTCSSGGSIVGSATPAGDGIYPSSAGFTPSSIGNYWWYVTSASDANNDPAASACGPGMTETVVGVASPVLTISNPTPPSTSTAGTTITGNSITAQLSGSSGTNATQTITFTVFGPQNSAPTTCTSGGTTVGTVTPAGDGTYHSSAGLTPTVAGNYWWYVAAPSNANNNAAASACGSAMTETTVSPANGSKLVFTTSPQSSTAGVSSGTITVQRLDQFNNPAANGALTVNLTTNSSGGIFRNTADSANITSLSIGGGSSAASFLYNDTVTGTPLITAADNAAILTSATQNETITAATPKLEFTTSAVSGIASTTATLGVITVQRADQYNNPITSGTTTVILTSTTPGSPSFSLTSGGAPVTSVTITAPASSVSFYYGDTKVGNPTVTAADNASLFASATQQETISADPESQLVFTTPSQTQVTNQVGGAMTIQRQDQFGNPTTSGPLAVNLSTTSSNVAFLNSGGTSTITGVTIADTASTASFTYQDFVGTPSITSSVTSGALTAATQVETINKASTTATVSASANALVTNQLITYTATVTVSGAGSGTPTGNIEFLDGGTPIAACGGSSGQAVNPGGTAACQTAPSTGSHTITAQYLGDANYSASAASPSISPLVVAPALTLSSRASGNWSTATTWTYNPSGTITSAINSCSVSGTGTKFTTELNIGTLLYNVNTKIGTVASIASDTALTLAGPTCTHAAVANIAYSARRVPTAADAVIITGGFKVTVPSAITAVAASLSLNPAETAAYTQVTLASSTSKLNIGGDLTLNPSGTVNNNTMLTIGVGAVTIGGALHYMGLTTNTGQCILTSLTSGSLTIAGDLTMANTGTATTCTAKSGFTTPKDMNDLDMSGGAGTLKLGGALTITNPANSTVRLASNANSIFNFAGVMPQTVPVPASINWIYSNINVNNTSSSGATLGSAVAATNETGALRVQSGAFSNGGFAIALATSKTFQVVNGATFDLTGTSAMVTGTTITKTFGASSTVNYAGSGQTVSNETYGNLILSGSGTITLPSTALAVAGNFTMSGTASATAAQNLTVAGNFSVGAGATFSAATFSHSITGNFSNGGTFNANSSTFTLSGSGATIGGSTTTFNNLTLANNISLTDVTGVNATVSGTLALGANILTTGANTVIANGSVTRTGATNTNGFVNGALQKAIASGATTPLFEVGVGTTYAPISLSITGANSGGNLTASSTTGQQPSYGSSGLSQTQYVNRYWTLAAGGGLTVTAYNGTFTFANPGDLTGSPNTAALNVKELAGGAWAAPTSVLSTSTTVAGTGFGTTFGSYASGN